jgi:hypothetical protein
MTAVNCLPYCFFNTTDFSFSHFLTPFPSYKLQDEEARVRALEEAEEKERVAAEAVKEAARKKKADKLAKQKEEGELRLSVFCVVFVCLSCVDTTNSSVKNKLLSFLLHL